MTASPLVLVVEDDQDIRDSIVEILQDNGYRVATAAHGLMALEYLTSCEELPDAIILDLMMPVMDGYKFREAQLKHPHWHAIPVCVISADERAHEKAATLGIFVGLRKPVKIDALLCFVKDCLEKKQIVTAM